MFSIKFSEVPNKENLLYNQELWYLLIISVILVTFMYDLGMILQVEIRCWLLLGV